MSDVIEHLREVMAQQAQLGEKLGNLPGADTATRAAYHDGFAAGIDYAIGVLLRQDAEGAAETMRRI